MYSIERVGLIHTSELNLHVPYSPLQPPAQQLELRLRPALPQLPASAHTPGFNTFVVRSGFNKGLLCREIGFNKYYSMERRGLINIIVEREWV
jgi:hypothetical protein